jgi:hypothetical protein
MDKHADGATHAAPGKFDPMLCEQATGEPIRSLRYSTATLAVPGAAALVTCSECIEWMHA